MRLRGEALGFACIQSRRRLQNADSIAIRCKPDGAIGMVRIATTRMSRNYDDLAVHRSGQMRTAAVVSDEKIAALQHGTHPVSYTHLRAHETDSYLVCRLL